MLKTEKPKQVQKIATLVKEHKIVGVLKMHKLPAKQLQQMREKLRGKAVIKMTKKSILKRSLPEELHGKLEGRKIEPALLFSNENPFRLYKILKENRTPASAKPGDLASKDIVISQGPTPLPPGPAISTLQKVGLKASVQGGKITIMQDKIVCKQGDTVSEDLASVLTLLKIEPLEIGLDLMVVLENGVLYEKSVLDIDQAVYINDIQSAVQKGINLSLNTGFITGFTSSMALQKAFVEARTLCIDANVPEKGFIDDVLAKAIREARALKNRVNVQ